MRFEIKSRFSRSIYIRYMFMYLKIWGCTMHIFKTRSYKKQVLLHYLAKSGVAGARARVTIECFTCCLCRYILIVILAFIYFCLIVSCYSVSIEIYLIFEILTVGIFEHLCRYGQNLSEETPFS